MRLHSGEIFPVQENGVCKQGLEAAMNRMNQPVSYLLFAFLLFVLPTCGPRKPLKKDPLDAPVPAAGVSLVEDMRRLMAENMNLRQQLTYMKKVSSESLEACEQQLETATQELEALREEARAAREPAAAVTPELSRSAGRIPTSQSKGSKEVKIKILSGDGNLDSARNLKEKLEEMAFRVDAVGLAPRSDFKWTTLYVRAGHESQGKNLASRLGENTRILPLTWSSIFDVIIVTGRMP